MWPKKKGYYSHYWLLRAISMCIIYKYVHDKSFSEESCFFLFFFLTFALWIHCVGFFRRQETHQHGSSMVCVPTAATDNDIISSFPGWTRRVSGRARAPTCLCSTLTLKGSLCLLASPPNYSRTSFDSDRAVSPDSSAVWGLRIALAVRLTSTRPLTYSPKKLSGSLSTWISEAWEGALVSSRG